MRTISFIFCHFLIQVIQELIHDILYSSGLTYLAQKMISQALKNLGGLGFLLKQEAKIFEPYSIKKCTNWCIESFNTFAH